MAMPLCRQASLPFPVTAARPCHHERRLRPFVQGQRRPTRCHSYQSDVLLVDAQNVLSRAHADHRRSCRLAGETTVGSFAAWLHFLAAAQPQLLVAVFDAPSVKRGPQQQRQALAPEYLSRRQKRKQAQHGQGGSGSSATLTAGTAQASSPAGRRAAGGDPLRPYKRQVAELGGLSLEAAGGWEADDGLAAACAAVQARHPTARVLVASGDGDMQQLLAPQVAWLQLHNQHSLSWPLGLELVTASAFQQQHGFPAAAYPDWLALVGKREASIQGAGVGGKSAAKLLTRYGGLEAVLAAAEAGELKGWGPAVARLVQGGAGSGGRGSRSSGGGDDAAWEQRKAQLRRNRRLFAAAADPSVVEPRGWVQFLAAAGSWAAAVAAAGSQAPGTDSTGALLPLLHGAMRHHIKLVQGAGYRVQLTLAAGGVLPPGLLAS
ncbi:hypothetical protein ABPG75_007506 [Micractinium tetrahymenae]